MEKILEFFLSNIPQTVGIFLLFGILAYMGIQAHTHRDDLWYAIKGDDGKLQLLEVIMAMWIVLFPIVVLSNLFLDRHLDPAIMISMDIILAIILGIKKFKDAGDVVKNFKETKETKETKTVERINEDIPDKPE